VYQGRLAVDQSISDFEKQNDLTATVNLDTDSNVASIPSEPADFLITAYIEFQPAFVDFDYATNSYTFVNIPGPASLNPCTGLCHFDVAKENKHR